MSNLPFGFGPSDPDDRGGRGSGGEGSGGPFGGMGGFDVSQLGEMLSQLGQMLSQASGSAGGPVNYDLAKQMALQKLGTAGLPSAGQAKAVTDAVRLAELWLDPVTTLPAGAGSAEAWAPRDWVERTLPTWRRLCDPVARRVSGAWVEALPAEARQAAGPLLAMVGQMGGMAFGSQLGNGLAQLAAEVFTSTDIGLPLGPDGVAALLPGSVDTFAKGLEREPGEVMVFLAAREAAHHRLFTQVQWLRHRLLSTVEEFANGIQVDVEGLQELAREIDPMNPASLERMMDSGLMQPRNTPEQQAALGRLETLLALVEGWVDVVVTDAVGERLPGADALAETLRRRRASGGPAEQTFATLVGLELRPRNLRAAAQLWRMLGEHRGLRGRDAVWNHPDLVPTAEDLDDPEGFASRDSAGLDDPIAELERAAGEIPVEHAPGQVEEGPVDERNAGGDEDEPGGNPAR